MKEYKSNEIRKMKGTVIGAPFFGTAYQSGDKILFLMKLGQDMTATFKKSDHITLQQGEAVVVKGMRECYLRKNDQIELIGQIVKLVLDDRARGESIYILAHLVYNETLRFSLYY